MKIESKSCLMPGIGGKYINDRDQSRGKLDDMILVQCTVFKCLNKKFIQRCAEVLPIWNMLCR